MQYEDDFAREVIGGVVIERVQMNRVTMREAQYFKERLLQDSVSGFNRIIIDLSKCSFVDSSIVGAMVVMLKRITEKGGELRVVKPDSEAFNVFTITGLYKVFNLYNSVTEALKDFD